MVSGGLLAPDGHYGTLEHLGGDGWVTSPPLVFQNQLVSDNSTCSTFFQSSRNSVDWNTPSNRPPPPPPPPNSRVYFASAGGMLRFSPSSSDRQRRGRNHPPHTLVSIPHGRKVIRRSRPTRGQRHVNASARHPDAFQKQKRFIHLHPSDGIATGRHTMASIRQQADGWRRNRRFLFRRDLDPQLDRFSFVSN